MIFKFLKKFFDFNERQLKIFREKVIEINNLEDKARKLKDEDFSKETERLKEKINGKKERLDKYLPWAYALTREAARRVLGQRHFDIQLMAAVALHQGKIAEQKTGEGKTLSAVPALYLNALLGRGSHLVTVNDYLARRDCGWMGQVFYFLGLKTAAIISERSFIFDPNYQDKEAYDWRLVNLRPISRKEAYQADVTYGINSEFGFDYLRDNMARSVDELVQRDFYFAIIDEADSILIDEARTPHIISAPYEEETSKYYQFAKIVNQLEEADYIVDERSKTVNLNEQGIKKIENLLDVDNLYEKDFDSLYHIEAALKAKVLFKKDRDYIVKDNEVIIVDEFTGRLLYGRRFSEGLHQAIEAKENVPIKQESKTLATVSLQNYFRMYEKLAGMTGTAVTEAEEFHKIYNIDVVVIPTNLPTIRKDYPDAIYKTEKAKFNAVVEEIIKNYQISRPVLVGTTSIEKNEYLSSLLKKRGIPHEVLNAKNHEKEAMIIAKAGEKGAITIATNMAGRGVDIILGGEPPNKFNIRNAKIDIKKEEERWLKKHEEVIKLGGLYVIGTERHESRRIDNQLRGRAGRQGDPGESRFFVSLEDDLMRIFGGDQIKNLMTFLNFPENEAISHPMVSRAIEQAQIKVEGFNFDIRKHLVEYDDVLNKQREIIYRLRRNVLLTQDKDKFYEIVYKILYEGITGLFNSFLAIEESINKEIIEKLNYELKTIYPLNFEVKTYQDIEKVKKEIKKLFKDKEKKFGEEIWMDLVRQLFLEIIDRHWMDHLTGIENLREGISLRGYAQIDPLVAYKNEAYSMFEKLINEINFELIRRILKFDLFDEKQMTNLFQNQPENVIYKQASGVDPFKKQEEKEDKVSSTNNQVLKKHKLGRNDPCWCGSGKKYKKCHYPN